MTIVTILILILYGFFLRHILRGISQGQLHYLLIYLVTFLPIYTVFLSFVYDNTDSVILVKVVQYSKELVVLFTLGVFLIGRKKNILLRSWSLSYLDWLFIFFTSLAFVYLMLPLGEASFFGKITYFKNISLLCLTYLFGRNVSMSTFQWKGIFKIIFAVTIVAFFVVVLENTFSRHFHSIIGYAKYNLAIHDIEPEGNYGLLWTFEAQAAQPRYGAIFANPLEFSASMLISFSLAIIFMLSMSFKANRSKYFVLLGVTFLCVLLAYSRATIAAFFGVLIFMAFLLKYYRLLIGGGVLFVALMTYVYFLAPDDTRYFVQDTISLQDSSSLGHVVEWVEGVESMIENPFGIGLAMSGNAGGVENDLQVGGENQFLIFGVQLGVVGMLIYLLIIFYGIRHSWLAFRMANTREEQIVPFVAACVKFGLLLPLFTSNVEVYLYVSLVSWWLIGASETLYTRYKSSKSLELRRIHES